MQKIQKLHIIYPRLEEAEKVSQVSETGKNSDNPLYSETRGTNFLIKKKYAKITKQNHASKGYNSKD